MLQFGDILNVVGRPGAIEAITVLLGNARQKIRTSTDVACFLLALV